MADMNGSVITLFGRAPVPQCPRAAYVHGIDRVWTEADTRQAQALAQDLGRLARVSQSPLFAGAWCRVRWH